jgi:hypothetical protein
MFMANNVLAAIGSVMVIRHVLAESDKKARDVG